MRRAGELRIAALAALLGLAAAGCHHDDCHDCGASPPATPVFFEVEPNDAVEQANHFGVLLPGDYFLIEGRITDTGFDPFDGFAFTAGSELHVDFQLFIDNVAADLDVCLFDPQLGATVDCFATAENPEQGGVDVTVGGLDFHLVVESFAGSSTYGLEIFVDTLFPAARTAQPGAVLAVGASSALDLPGKDARAFDAYANPPSPARLQRTITTEVDVESGLVLEMVTTERLR